MPDFSSAVLFSTFGTSALICVIYTSVLVRYYVRRQDRSCFLLSTSVVSITAPLLLSLLLAVDVYTVSHLDDIAADEELSQEGKLDRIYERTGPVRYIAYGLLCSSAVFGCIIVPFGYFWFEEEGAFGFEVPRTGTRVCGAAKYVAALLVLFGGLATMSLAVPLGHTISSLREDGFEWLDTKWSPVLRSPVSTVANFIFMTLACLGIPVWICYTAVGTATLPIHTLKGQRHVKQLQSTQEERQRLISDRYESIRAKGQTWGVRSLSRREQRDVVTAERESRLLEHDRLTLQSSQTTMNRFLTASPCLRWLLGVPFLVVSLAIFETVGVVAVDTTLSNYGLEYGLVLANPIQSVQQYSAMGLLFGLGCQTSLWFLDFIILGSVILYLLTCTLYGMFIVGMLGVAKIGPHQTRPQSMLAASFVANLALLSMAAVLPSWVPGHFTYGCQNANDVAMPTCTRETEPPFECVTSQLAVISTFLRLSIAPVGVYVYAAQWAFVGVGMLSTILALCRVRASTADEVDRTDNGFW